MKGVSRMDVLETLESYVVIRVLLTQEPRLCELKRLALEDGPAPETRIQEILDQVEEDLETVVQELLSLLPEGPDQEAAAVRLLQRAFARIEGGTLDPAASHAELMN